MTILCMAGYEKGHEFLREAKRQGCTVILLTSQSLQGKAAWPMESIDEVFYMPDQDHGWDRADTVKAVSYLARTRVIDRIVLDEAFGRVYPISGFLVAAVYVALLRNVFSHNYCLRL